MESNSSLPYKIILVHGTWGRGIFPDTIGRLTTKLRNVLHRTPGPPRWFECGSQFRAALENALHDLSIIHTITALTWSGSNSVFAREIAAAKLADRLRTDLSDNPEQRALIIAHSHGGNVALRSLEYIPELSARIDIVTLATPFLRIFPMETVHPHLWFFLGIPFAIPTMIVGIILFGSGFLDSPERMIYPGGHEQPVISQLRLGALLGTGILLSWLWLKVVLNLYPNRKYMQRDAKGYYKIARGHGWSERPYRLADAANYKPIGAYGPKLLVVRGVDDEASLALAAGAIVSRLGYLAMIKLTLVSIVLVPIGIGLAEAFLSMLGWPWGTTASKTNDLMYTLIAIGCTGSVLGALLAGVFKTAFGREFVVGAVRCNIAVNSVPDSVGNSEAVTLPSFAPSALETHHYIYNHPFCVREIAAWIEKGIKI